MLFQSVYLWFFVSFFWLFTTMGTKLDEHSDRNLPSSTLPMSYVRLPSLCHRLQPSPWLHCAVRTFWRFDATKLPGAGARFNFTPATVITATHNVHRGSRSCLVCYLPTMRHRQASGVRRCVIGRGYFNRGYTMEREKCENLPLLLHISSLCPTFTDFLLWKSMWQTYSNSLTWGNKGFIYIHMGTVYGTRILGSEVLDRRALNWQMTQHQRFSNFMDSR